MKSPTLITFAVCVLAASATAQTPPVVRCATCNPRSSSTRIEPVYPREIQRERIQGLVRLEAIIEDVAVAEAVGSWELSAKRGLEFVAVRRGDAGRVRSFRSGSPLVAVQRSSRTDERANGSRD